ncbi:hypothetical protein JG688_00007031 [Phytophthora aleatoria]|uniref:Uncharacterized protein n=1 Tax=Phytophthora aleatoria TaxID=2496075 RepID=A0A8J5J8G7_9STRA|nr:hypothetical protein JG688_00007031 [Phytophthora aleatoria]
MYPCPTYWTLKQKRPLVPERFANVIVCNARGLTTKQSIKLALASAPDIPPVDFDQITAHYHRAKSAEPARELSSDFMGLQRNAAAALSQGLGQIKIGKDPMSIGLYKQVALAMLKSTSRDMIFARTFMIMSWNLMSRAATTASICYNYLEWRDDALCVYFAHMKYDQRGTRPRDPRHVYTNSLTPEICPILALGRVLKCLVVAAELGRRGAIADDIGTHSLRKGASALCTSGSTARPPPTHTLCLFIFVLAGR